MITRLKAAHLSVAAAAVLAVGLLGLVLVPSDEATTHASAPRRAAPIAAATDPAVASALSGGQIPSSPQAPSSRPLAATDSDAPVAEGRATAAGPPAIEFSPCTDPDQPNLDVACLLPEGTIGQLLRQVCSYAWIAGLCESTAFPSPGYATSTEPHPDAPLRQLVGAVHNHSGYSDGDPLTIPRDYWNAARTGHNTADSGGDTGVKLDFLWSSDHSDNEQLPITTAAACLDPAGFLSCSHVGENDDYWKWPATLRQAREATDYSPIGGFNGFTAIRGFEWTNDYFNHMNVYFSTNFVNVKVDGSYVSMDFMWNWLRKPVDQGGGADALLTFNHPGGDPALTPFDGGTPLNELLATFPGGSNWNDVAYVPDVDARVAGMEVNGGDDIEWYVKALTKGWHIGAVSNEDEHQREWSTSTTGKTLILTRGRSPQDYYAAFERHRTTAILDALVSGAGGTPAQVPTILYYADGSGPGGLGVQDPAATLLGSATSPGDHHDLHLQVTGLPAGSKLALVSNTTRGQQSPIALGAASPTGAASISRTVTSPSAGTDWYFVVICPAAATRCGTDQNYTGVTAPIWVGPDR